MPVAHDWFTGAGFMPHGHCYLWDPALVGLEVAANGLVAAAYLSISITLFYIVKKIQNIPFQWMYVAFGVFIVTCGITHAFDVLVIWHPAYWPDATVRAVTAAASVGTAVLLPPLVPKAVSLAEAAGLAHRRGADLEKANRELGLLLDRARELEQLKTSFFANVSHELRTPLTLILGPIENLLADAGLAEEHGRELAIVHRNARLLLKHVEDLLDVARLDAGQSAPEYATVDLAALVRTTASLFESLAEDRAIALQVDAPDEIVVQVDSDKIQRVLVNLLSNAFKFTPRNGHIRCSVRPLPEDAGPKNADRLAIEIADSGPGIPVAERSRVFERFLQLERGATRRHGGTGLGLAIAKDFVALHGGRIEIADAPEGGALLRVELPVRPRQHKAAQPPAASDSRISPRALLQVQAELSVRSSSSFKASEPSAPNDPAVLQTAPARAETAEPPALALPLVLVIEDHPEMNHFIRSALKDEFRTEAALDGARGLEAARELLPDAIVCDLMMPGMSGEEVVKELRSGNDRMSDVPVVLLTARADDEQRASLLRQGAQDYVLKPFSPDELRARVANWVRISRAKRLLSSELSVREQDIEQLAHEVVRRGRELQAALDSLKIARTQAEQANRFKTDFLGMVSHELRTPLTALQLQIEHLRRSKAIDPEVSPAPAMALTRMWTAVSRLASLIDSLLQYTRIESGKLLIKPHRVDLGRLAAEVVEELRPQAENKRLGLAMVAPERAEIESDPQLIRLTLANLVSNAVKFTERGSVRVVVRDTPIDVSIDVTDSGPGIPMDQRGRIFEPFEHLEPVASKHTPGFGLGLALVREMMRVLGGRVELSSRVGEGSTFTVVFPKETRFELGSSKPPHGLPSV